MRATEKTLSESSKNWWADLPVDVATDLNRLVEFKPLTGLDEANMFTTELEAWMALARFVARYGKISMANLHLLRKNKFYDPETGQPVSGTVAEELESRFQARVDKFEAVLERCEQRIQELT